MYFQRDNEIRLSPTGKPVDVIVVFNPLGDIKPVTVRLKDESDNYIKMDITGVKYTKDLIRNTGRSFRCCYMVDNIQNECTVTFYYSLCKWYLET
ncbi:hypothetical protein [Anaerocolumna chitinilytica]|uniref:Uncharacterized protein n=1 Tax=Anaerocolumna chitinilytica TaxID=1727145 RepID=A0A7M3SAJ8_9FIRM|nr:hypothetical protein [Anaerocolumna chitinilytica]BCK01616.1 hypothetical protein bsdcttw_46560 [Anaerocolumna chitinilytica]